MVKAIAKSVKDGKTYVFIGFSWANLDKLRDHGLNGHIKIDGAEMGISVNIIITAAETEQEIADLLLGNDFIGPDTKVDISDKLKN